MGSTYTGDKNKMSAMMFPEIKQIKPTSANFLQLTYKVYMSSPLLIL